MRLEAHLAKFMYNFDKIQKERKVYYDDIVFLENHDNYPELVIGKENASRTFVGQSHFRGKERGNDFYVMVFKIVDLQENERPEDFNIYYTPKKDTVGTKLTYDPRFQIFFDLPKLRWDRNAKKYTFSNDLDKAQLGTLNAGVFYLNVYRNDEPEPVNRDEYKVLILPSSLPFSSYQQMVDDIVQIKKELVMEKIAGKQSVQLNWEHTLNDFARVLDEIAYPLRKINAQPKVKLQETYKKVSLRSLKKFTPKTLQNIIQNEGISSYIAPTTIESTAIYENEMIYYALTKLKQYIETFREQRAKQLAEDMDEAKRAKKKILETFNVSNLEQLENILLKFRTNPDIRSAFYDNMIHTLEASQTSAEDTVEVIFKVAYNHPVKPSISFSNKKLLCTFHSMNQYNGNYYLDFKHNGRPLSYSIVNGRQNIPIRDRSAKISLETANLNEQLFFLDYFMNVTEPMILTIHAVVKKNRLNQEDPLRGNPIKIWYEDGYYPNLYHYSPKIIKLKAINGRSVPTYTTNVYENLKNYYIRYGTILATDEHLDEITSIKKKLQVKQKQSAHFNETLHQVDALLLKVDNLLQLPLFERLRLRKLHWQLTQIFINDRYYSRVWKLLRNLDKTYFFTDDFAEADVIVKKADTLYEYWLFITIIKQLKQSGWKIVNDHTLLQAVQQFLRTKRNRTELEGIEITLEHPGTTKHLSAFTVNIEKINITIAFNKPFGRKLPDYRMTIEVVPKDRQQSEEKVFFLDAKYRNYDDQGGKNKWYFDINDVAIDKYSNFFHQNNLPSDGAFIIHPDVNKQYTYFGGYVTEEMLAALHIVEKLPDRNPRHTFGSIACRPGEVRHLKTLLRMLLEYHFVHIHTPFICFDCGSSNIAVEERETMGRNTKYHIRCNDCGDFWVRTHCSDHGHYLIKHQPSNYHQEEDDSPWFVKCPECNLTSAEESYMNIDWMSDSDLPF